MTTDTEDTRTLEELMLEDAAWLAGEGLFGQSADAVALANYLHRESDDEHLLDFGPPVSVESDSEDYGVITIPKYEDCDRSLD